jgi:hypothetical protein
MDPSSTSVPDLVRLLHVPSVPQLEHPTPSNRRTVRQAVQSYVFPTPSVCIGTASMAHTPVNSSLGRILCMLQPPATHACIDSGASCEMCPIKEFFEKRLCSLH